jgi:diadenosine tetraphosphate (Ap4A) HIT family hydrolase
MSRHTLDPDAYAARCREGPCFICAMLAGEPGSHHHVVFEDAETVAFLNKYPTLYGYVLVAPREHREQVTGDFSLGDYLALQRVIYRVAEAVRAEVRAERVYILSLGSQQGNRHVHWHVAPLPSGVPYADQQLEALRMERGVLDLPEEELASLARRLRQRLAAMAEEQVG